ncbi:ExbD/TolR family protein [Pedobacter metabolipauper]|uniref:Outer membrane transport energization protein ExbD n=1 Tax=Pedobacter metabolipauper TaxID=425513 RepID=A0A4R6SWJ9_9SPHI|nr:biopolymer transporter ExbD [Pedobacter metabolipauper]TDQ09791.1 outer membrane transport energization protein ExbD [Pedobacter metabolipauper]
MATLNISQSGQAAKGQARTRKPVPAVDLTAMVDLAFLLITFFMLTTSLSKYQAMDVAKPVIDIPDQPYPASRTVTLILGKDNHILWYKGELEKTVPQQTSFKQIGSVLNQNKKQIAGIYKNDPAKFMIVIIKPTEQSNYKNFVDVLDEMKIADVKSHMIDDKGLLDLEHSYLIKNQM